MKKIVPVIGSPGERVTRSRKARLMEAAEGQNADLEAARRRVGEILRGENTDADDVIHELLPLVYDQLRGLARRQMKAERVDHTLQATALVNEAFCRLVGDRKIPWDGPAHFYAAASEAMRRILIDYARTRGRQKRGGNRKRVPLTDINLGDSDACDDILALDEALSRLEGENPEAAKVVQLRFFAGLSIDETAQAMGLSPRTVDRRWKFARAWLYQNMAESET